MERGTKTTPKLPLILERKGHLLPIPQNKVNRNPLNLRPIPLISNTALFASSEDSNLTKAKPQPCLVLLLTGMKESMICPALQNIASNSTFKIVGFRLDMNGEMDCFIIERMPFGKAETSPEQSLPYPDTMPVALLISLPSSLPSAPIPFLPTLLSASFLTSLSALISCRHLLLSCSSLVQYCLS